MKARKSYHHGDLRRSLLDAALAQIEETGLEGLSLRKVAARVGVSHAAPEHHFPSLRHLFTAMAAEGFSLFVNAMVTARAEAPATPVDQLRAARVGYLDYARAHPALFRLMFNSGSLDWTDQRLGEVATLAYDQLRQVCAPAAKAKGLTRPEEIAGLERLVWSQIHGEAHLIIDDKLVDPTNPDCPPMPARLDMAWLLFPDEAGRAVKHA